MVFQQQEKRGETIVGRCCFVDEESEELSDYSVLAIGRTKSVEQWCFSIGRKSKVLNSGVSASGKMMKSC
jgi:hypothetical protein